MAWKRLTRGPIKYYVNLDEIAYLHEGEGWTAVFFSARASDSKILSITVDQAPFEILKNEEIA